MSYQMCHIYHCAFVRLGAHLQMLYVNSYPWIFGTVTERELRGKIQSTETYINDTTLRSVFSAKHAR